nr:immunoglobulin light chain junction region [Macaca mulatta]
CVSWHNNSVLF